MATAPPPPPPDLRPLRVGEILDVGIKIYTRHAKTLFQLVAIVVVPVQAIGVLILLSTIPDALAGQSQNPFDFSNPAAPMEVDGGEILVSVVGQLLVVFLGFVSTTIATGAAFKAVSDAYLGGPPDWRTSLTFALRRTRSLLWLVFLSGVATGIGFVLCLLPGVWLAIVWSVAVPVLLTEGTKGTKALGRSFHLVQSRFWPSAGVLALSFLIRMVVGSAISGLLVAFMFTEPGQNVLLQQVLGGVVGALTAILTTPFQAAVVSVLYFDLRVRSEGFDLQLLAQRMEMPDPTSAHAALMPPPIPPMTMYPQQPGAYPPGTPPPPPYQGPPPVEGLAIASLICGFIFCIGSIPAVVMGHMAMRRIDRSQGAQGGRAMALAGTILGYIGIAGGFAFVLLVS